MDVSKEQWQKVKQLYQSYLEHKSQGTEALAQWCESQGHHGVRIDGEIIHFVHFHQVGRRAIETDGIEGLEHTFVVIEEQLFAMGKQLGEGGQGRVMYVQNEDDSVLAVKIERKPKDIKPGEVTKEARGLQRMGRLIASGQSDSEFYTVMPYYKGSDLDTIHKRYTSKGIWLEAAKLADIEIQTKGGTPIIEQAVLAISDRPDLVHIDSLGSSRFDIDDFQLYSGITGLTQEHLDALRAAEKTLHEKYSYSLEQRYQFALGALDEIEVVLDAGLLHRDIKGANFLGQITEDGKVEVHISDFGMAQFPGEVAESFAGSPTYSAPEVLCCFPARMGTNLKYLDTAARKRYEALEAQGHTLPRKAQYSTESEIFSYAIMCQRDFNLPEDAGFGILKQCMQDDPAARPPIAVIKACLKLDYLMRFSGDKKVEVLAHIKLMPYEAAQIINERISTYKLECMQTYQQMHKTAKGMFGKTNTKELQSFDDVIKYAQTYLRQRGSPIKSRATPPGKRTAAILIRMGILEGNGDLKEPLKSLDKLEQPLNELLTERDLTGPSITGVMP